MTLTVNLTKTLIARAKPGQQTLRQLSYSIRSCRQFPAAFAGSLPRLQIQYPQIVAKSATTYTPLRFFSSSKSEPQYAISNLSDDDYHAISDACMDRMVEYFEDLGDEHDIPGYDVEYQSGVMTLKLGDKGTYVVNKQPPNKQLWLSSPLTGPKRYDYDLKHNSWFYNRDHHFLKHLLDTEISEALGFEIDVPLDGLGHE